MTVMASSKINDLFHHSPHWPRARPPYMTISHTMATKALQRSCYSGKNTSSRPRQSKCGIIHHRDVATNYTKFSANTHRKWTVSHSLHVSIHKFYFPAVFFNPLSAKRFTVLERHTMRANLGTSCEVWLGWIAISGVAQNTHTERD